MHGIAEAPIATPRRNWIVLTAVALAVAAGLVALGRYTAPGTKTVFASAAPAACGTLAPATAPSPACARVLESAFGGGGAQPAAFSAVMAPKTLPPRYAQRVLEAIYGGIPLNANRP
jgi:hypothetical protein